MGLRAARWAGRIRAFVENPITNLVKGLALMVIGLSEAWDTFSDDLAHRHLRAGHGLIIIGIFSVLGALPHLIESLEAWSSYLDAREKKGTDGGDAPAPGDRPPDQTD